MYWEDRHPLAMSFYENRKFFWMKNILFATALLLGAASCTDKTAPVTGPSNPPTDCRTVMCTMEFRTINIQVVDAGGNPVKLDSYQTTLAGKNTVVGNTGAMQPGENGGDYPVVSDAFVGDNKNTRTKMIFTGMKDGKTVVNETYEIGVDCCHVSRISGKEKVVVR